MNQDRQNLDQLDPPPAPAMGHYMVRSTSWPGYWGRAPTIDRAVKAAEWFQVGDKVHLMKVDESAYCDAFGTLHYEARERLGVGTLRRNRQGVWRVDGLDPTKV